MNVVTETDLPLKVFKKGKVVSKVKEDELFNALFKEIEKITRSNMSKGIT